MFGKDLIKDLKSELSGDYWKVVYALCQPHAEYDASELRNAIKVSWLFEFRVDMQCHRSGSGMHRL